MLMVSLQPLGYSLETQTPIILSLVIMLFIIYLYNYKSSTPLLGILPNSYPYLYAPCE